MLYSEMLTMCSFQLQVFEKVGRRCLREDVSFIIMPSIEVRGMKDGASFSRSQHGQCFAWTEGY